MLNNDFLNYLKTVTNKTDLLVKKLKYEQKNKEIYLYGCGNHVKYVVSYLKSHDVHVVAILDTFKEGTFAGIPVIRYSDFLSGFPNPERCVIVISAPSKAKVISDSLKEINDWDIEVFTGVSGLGAFIDDLDKYRNYISKNWIEFTQFYNSLEDDLSKKTFEYVLKGRVSGNSEYFAKCYVSNQYYPDDIIKFSDNEVIVDLGAYNGDTFAEFIKLCPEYKSAYCFEPEEECFKQLKLIVDKQVKSGKSAFAIKKGAWNESCKLKFSHSSGTEGTILFDSSNEDEENICIIDVASVDDEVKECVTYMKMDIEGSELAALHGAKRQISENKPKLAVCVYHKTEDFLDIWNYLRSLVPEYKFYLRHHMEHHISETVLYAVCDKKETIVWKK